MSGFTYSIEDVAGITNGKLHSHEKGEHISSVAIDSRRIHSWKHTLFFALKGKQHDAHNYIPELAAKGCKNFVVSDISSVKNIQNINVIEVDDTLDALQLFASSHRKQFKIPVVAITGSNGKTIVKEWLFQFLKDRFHITRSPKSYNSQVGVPLSVLQLNAESELAIFEAGISMKGEMEKLEKIIQPEMVIITNIGQAHSENFPDNKEKLHEKALLLKNAKSVVYCSDSPEIENEIESNYSSLKKYNWSQKKDAFVKISEVIVFSRHCSVKFIFKGVEYETEIPFTDAASFENCMNALVASLALNSKVEEVIQKPSQLLPVEMRMEQLEGINNCLLINDSYSSDKDSLSIALDLLNQQKHYDKKTVILSDIVQDKTPEEKLYSEIVSLLNQKKISRLIGIGEHIPKFSSGFKGEKLFFSSTDQFLQSEGAGDFSNEVILIKGARKFGFEKITEHLQQKSHETVLEINLDSVAHNLNYYRSKLNPGTKIMAMVKAFSYGSGGAEMAQLLEFNRTDYLAVAYADEGVELRNSGITLPILVMNPEKHSFETMLRYKLEPEIYSGKIFHEFLDAADRNNRSENLFIHIKIDSGMHRLGFTENEIPDLISLLSQNKSVIVRSVFSHLAASDDPAMDDLTKKQISIFKNCTDQIEKAVGYNVLKHILNSAGISRFKESQFDMVRLGIGLYGIGVTDEDKKQLIPASTFKTIISQIKQVKKGENIGYTGKNKTIKDAVIATLPLGYADGFTRHLGNGKGYVLIGGKKAPVIGNVCMDMCMVDISGITGVNEGDEAIIFGAGLPVEEFAINAGTIPYEVLTSISRRVKRVYVRE